MIGRPGYVQPRSGRSSDYPHARRVNRLMPNIVAPLGQRSRAFEEVSTEYAVSQPVFRAANAAAISGVTSELPPPRSQFARPLCRSLRRT